MLQKIHSDNYCIYTNEIINSEEFLRLYNCEKILIQFKTLVTTCSHHPFATFLSEQRKSVGINVGIIIILRVIKQNNKFEFITKIGKWGKFSIPKELIETLDIKNHERILFEVVKESKRQGNIDKKSIDLTKIEGYNIIYREGNLITLFKKARTIITLPRFIKISPELVELFFLIHGDGHYQYKLYFVNKNYELIDFVMEEFEKILKISRDYWRARVLFNNSSNPEEAKAFWKNKLKLKEEQFYPTISKSILNTSEIGNLRIVLETPIISDLFKYIFEEIQKNDDYLFYALNGLLCAEGGARKNKRGLHKITISFSQKEKLMFENILRNTKILELCKISQNSRFCIEKWDNLYLFFKIFFSNNIIPFNLHSQRCKNALDGFLNHGFTQTITKYLYILNKKEEFEVKDLVNEMGYLPNSILNTLRKKQYSQFIKIGGRGIKGNPFIISITSEGKEFITLIKNMREAYNARY